MTKSWRPEGWKNPTLNLLDDIAFDAYEDGADAMLEALRDRYNPQLLTPLSPFPIEFKGSKLVLIPDDEKEGKDEQKRNGKGSSNCPVRRV